MLSSTLMTSFEMFIYDPLDIGVLQPERYLLDFSPVIISHIETVPGMRPNVRYGIILHPDEMIEIIIFDLLPGVFPYALDDLEILVRYGPEERTSEFELLS